MLECGGHHATCAGGRRTGRAVQGQIVRLASAAREDHGVRTRSDQPGDLLTG